ncbi:Misato Segment II myosin-like protein [Macrophomina phaseolina MS6]|uniref:Misato Segment II myosin-like protein n=1 Tax=Macrophomina phaseolina (strain MS6) TaxID=1126212 RepID=K2RR46_MACPH|nr:Misato Segment II myosin-like protein [Macrophomina phaseolina MS6]
MIAVAPDRDIAASPFMRPTLAVYSLTSGLTSILDRPSTAAGAVKQCQHPHAIAIGGEHLVTLPALRALHAATRSNASNSSEQQRIDQPTLNHIDAHLDTLRPAAYPPGADPEEYDLNHGTVLRPSRP